MKRSIQKRQEQKGFTLIEIIAVLVILGVLAAVAVPRYFDLQANAAQSAVNANAAEIQARINQGFAQALLQGRTCAQAQTAAQAQAADGAIGGGWTASNISWVTTGTDANGDPTETPRFISPVSLSHATATGGTAIAATGGVQALSTPSCN